MVDRPALASPGKPPGDAGASAKPGMLGRFELRRVLGQGAQAVVWLAFDPRLEREVAIKRMKPASLGAPSAVPRWLQEARSMSRLTHPNSVPVFEADVQDQQAYLVFEYVSGQTLSSLIASRGVLPAAEAVVLVMDVLDALVVAHAAGVAHRDLKPSNIRVDETGRARVMDFGIASRMHDVAAAGTELVGTPDYMSPEAARAAPATPSIDLFAVDLVMAEMLSGKPLLGERDPYRAIYRLLHEPLALPASLGADVDDWLRAMVNRALRREPAQRPDSALALRAELARWSGIATEGERKGKGKGAGGAAGNSTLEFLQRRMRHKGDFPAMSRSVVRIQEMAISESESVGRVTHEILKDVGLTNKLLRLVNSAHYAMWTRWSRPST